VLTFRSQKELINTHSTVPTIRRDITDTHTTVSSIHHKTLKSPDETRSKDRAVSTTRTLPFAE